MSDKIRVTGIEGLGYHGLYDSEREIGQPFVVDVVLKLDLEKAGQTDEIQYTVDYNDIAQLIYNEIVGPPMKLLETMAEKICHKILAAYPPIEEIEVTVHKPRAPISVPFGDVSITIKRER
ncbi:MAG: dihydroneopterin aldolase [Actinomycetota bacterium]